MFEQSVLMGGNAVISSAVPLLQRPDYVEMYGANSPFITDTFQTTQESEASSYENTASSGCIGMARSTSSATSASASISGWGASASVSGSTSQASEENRTDSSEKRRNAERNRKTSSAHIIETIQMPMMNFRIPYDAMKLSEDAKHKIQNMQTEREAEDFLILYGSHLPKGMHTAGGIFFRTMTMQSETEVSSLSLYSAAGKQLSESKSKSSSAGASAGGKAWGVRVSASVSSSSGTTSGSSEVSTNSQGTGQSDAKTTATHTLKISSLGPNATNAQDFYDSLSTNSGSWGMYLTILAHSFYCII